MDARAAARSRGGGVSDRRLSRELEEGFADDSDEDEEDGMTVRNYA